MLRHQSHNISFYAKLLLTAHLFTCVNCWKINFICPFQMCLKEGFRQLVVEDAQSVKQRQETDSIDIVDEIRYMLVSNFVTIDQIGRLFWKVNVKNVLTKVAQKDFRLVLNRSIYVKTAVFMQLLETFGLLFYSNTWSH